MSEQQENVSDVANVQRRLSVGGIKPPGWAVGQGEVTTPKKENDDAASSTPKMDEKSVKKSTARKARQRRKTDSVAFMTPKRSEIDEIDEFDLGGVTIDGIADRIMGTEEERETRKADLLRRVKPEQKLYGYAKKYMENETKRLASGIREQYLIRDTFMNECKQYESTLQRTLASAKMTVTRIRNQVASLEAKLEERDFELGTLRQNESSLKIKLQDMSEEVKSFSLKEDAMKAEQASVLEKNAALREEISSLKESLSANVTLVEKLEAQIQESQQSQKLLGENLEVLKRERDQVVADLNKEFSQAKAEWNTNQQLAQQKYEEACKKIEEADRLTASMRIEIQKAESQAKITEEKLLRSTVGHDSLKAQLQSMDEQAKQKDAHLNKTLETFQDNQRFSQERIADLSDAKSKLEARVHDLFQERNTLEVEAATLQAKFRETTEANAALTSRVKALEKDAEEALEKTKKLEEIAKSADARVEQETRKVAALTVEGTKLKQRLELEDKRAQSAIAEQEKLKESISELTQRNCDLEDELTVLKETYKSSADNSQLERLCEVSKEAERLKRKVNDHDKIEAELSELRAKLKDTEAKLFEADKAKRKLHNDVQALKGKVRVVARIRPIVNEREEAKEGESSSVTDLPEFLSCGLDGQSLALKTELEQSKGTETKLHKFNLDRVFTPGSQQAIVFDEVSSFVQSALDGYNVCLFSYGQTGSGKTYTMTGDLSSDECRGIIPRSIDQIMSYQTELRAKGWEYTLEATYIEIYNETICDLLSSEGNQKDGMKLEIRDSKKEILVSNATRLPISSKEDISKLLRKADAKRSVAATDSNQQSSRSHSVFTLFIKGTQREFGAQVTGSLSMCDLAGSERLSRSNAEGERLKEAQSINKSLSALANVFSALHQKAGHVPYRNSKLTHMLQPCFAGEGKTMMIVNLSPELSDRNESLCSLRFAGQVAATELGRAKKQISKLAPAN